MNTTTAALRRKDLTGGIRCISMATYLCSQVVLFILRDLQRKKGDNRFHGNSQRSHEKNTRLRFRSFLAARIDGMIF